jgi:5-formyltetrahydrofolate cyclo-ligase
LVQKLDTTARDRDAQRRAMQEAVRERIWEELRAVARPDSRFHWDFSSFIADYDGSEANAERIRALPAWQSATLLFITPDNNLEAVRRLAMADRKPFVMSTYGIARGFFYVAAGAVPADKWDWAATLDGMERFGQPVGLRQIQDLGQFDLLVTGASAISTHGIRFGKGHGYFDLEWAMFCEAGCIAPDALVIAAGHDCQVVEVELPASEFDTGVDLIVTPTRVIPVPAGHRPGRIVWDALEPDMPARIPPLRELRALLLR